ncbi:MAG: hypothetical protein HC837_19880 [Chloroflexaceae bacterium]|nr:hypothetical protein [Chloroflexaceae bacterium]
MMNMIVCHVCGATNDPGNRFCDQCGARLEQPLSQVTPPVLEAPPPQADPPTAVATLNCVVCGATVLPGMVFCDHCGADLRAHPPLSSGPGDTETTIDQEGDPTWLNSSLAPTIIPASADPDLPVVSPDDATVFAPSTQDDAWDQTDMADASTAPTMIDPDLTAEASPPLADPNVPTASPAELPAADVPVLPEESVPESDSIPPVSDDPPQMFAVPGTAPDLDMQGPGTAPDLDAPVPATAPDLDAPALSAEQQQLAEEIERHTSTIVNMEQMLTMYPAGAAPGYLVSALDDARQALADAEARQAARQQPVPDPAEVARLEADRTRHQATITQMEQILQMHPPDAAPAYLVSALEDARRARDATEQEMAALMGGSAGRRRCQRPRRRSHRRRRMPHRWMFQQARRPYQLRRQSPFLRHPPILVSWW